ALADALAGNAPSKEAAEIGLRIMNSSGRRDDRLAQLFSAAIGGSKSVKPMNRDETLALAAEVKRDGDAKAGAQIFQRTELGCLVCHSVNGKGGNIGPNLSALGTAQPIDFIIGAILEPQKEIKEGFMSISVTTKDGDEFQGYGIRETKDEFVLRDALQNKEIHIAQNRIAAKKQNGSLMPSGLAENLTRAEFRDLVKYLSELGK
ncbi:MAG TPA: c-type cytochrome, partial [Verrucomicrobiae bacterium]